MIDLSKLSDADFKALQANNLSAMSDAGFGMLLQGQQASLSTPERVAQARDIARERQNPTLGMGTGNLLAAGAGKAVSDIGLGIGQLAGQVSRGDVDALRSIDNPLMQTAAGRGGNMLGTMAVAAPALMIPGANSAAGAAIIGGIEGLTQPVGEEDSRGINTALGVGGNLLGTGLANGLSRVIQPKPPAGVGNLLGRGVELTPGQRLGGAFKRAEDAMTSIPVNGDMIKTAQRQSFGSFNTAVANEALSKIGAKLPKDTFGRDAVAYTERAIGDAYEGALSQIKTVQGDSQFAQEIASLQAMVRSSTMPKDVQAQFNNAIKAQLKDKFQGRNTMTAQTFKDAESELGRLATKYQADASADKQLLGDALQEAQSSLRGLLERAAGPDLAKDVKNANAAWAEFKRMQRASSFLGAEDGVFSPENYLNAVKALDRSKDKGAFARGNALGEELASDAVRVMGRKVPDSGTPFRTLMAEPMKGVPSAVIASPLGLAYSKPVQNALRALLDPSRPAIAAPTARELEMLAPLLGIATGAAIETGRQ